MLFDDWLITVNATAFTTSGDNFRGIWGIGERITNFFYQDGVYTTLARDNGNPWDNGTPPGNGEYGVHPIYWGKNDQSKYFAVFNLNAAPADWYIKNDPVTG